MYWFFVADSAKCKCCFFFFSSRRRHTRSKRDWSSDVCSSDLPDTAKEKPIQGEVIAVGPGRLEKGQRVPMELKVGDRVVYGKYTGSRVELDEEEITLIKESDVIAKLS